ncbi:MAG: aminopeptidase [Acidimicrobiales bacterium]|nr:MAG: aminopeptidase [Acidimicrobiales bacterium]
MATTQFEPTDARRAFPCWDEPDMKAVFALTLVVPRGAVAVSNSPELRREPVPGRPDVERVVFAETIPMSTYLVAFVVGPLETTGPMDVDGVPIRVVHVPGKGELAQFALEVASFCLRWFREYYDIPYPGQKLDLVALPDFAFGAMENLGCVTFREVLVLVDPERASQPELQAVVDVIAHELAHMWFGDLVTMRWWNGIWLNEAFATFMEMKATDAFRPDWKRFVSFGLSRSAALDVDALDTTRSIEYEVVTPQDAEGMFDLLTYEKGAAVLWMLESWLGEERFREGIRLYLRRHGFSNTETTDLWDAIEEATGEPVRRIMDSWIFQGGFPLVEVRREGDDIVFSQQRFRYLHADDGTRWSIPLVFRDVSGEKRALLEGDSVRVRSPHDGWIVVNSGASGFYRVGRSVDSASALVAEGRLQPLERYAVVDDSWALLSAGRSTCGEYLELLRGFVTEDDLAVWQRIVATLRHLDRLVPDDSRPAWQSFVRDLVRPALERSGDPADGEEDRQRQLRASLFEALGVLGADEEVRRRARQIVYGEETVDPDLEGAAVAVVADGGSHRDWEYFVDRHRGAATPQEEIRYLYALADFPEDELVARTCRMTLTDEVRTQNAPYLLRRALTNRRHGRLAWEFVRSEWERIVDRFPSNSIVRMLEGVRSLDTPELAEDVFSFFAERDVPQGRLILAQHLEKLRVNLEMRRREAANLAESLG